MAGTDITLAPRCQSLPSNIIEAMGRWQPDAQGRLAQAAFELFGERGYEQTTVAEIAARAGLTERTFFRHYADKREVLFAGSDMLRERFVSTIADAPVSASPKEAMTSAVEAAAKLLDQERGREFARRRQQIIVGNPELQERELIKLAGISSALAQTLRERGVEEPRASLTAELGISVFRVAFECWVADGSERGLDELVHVALGQLAEVVA
jgi:AcrR family transcriptional regulator